MLLAHVPSFQILETLHKLVEVYGIRGIEVILVEKRLLRASFVQSFVETVLYIGVNSCSPRVLHRAPHVPWTR